MRALCAFVLSSCLWLLIKVSPYFVCFAGVATLPTPPCYVCVCVCVNLHMFLLVWKSRYLFGAKFHLLGSRIYSPWTWPPPLKSIESFWCDSETSFRLKKNSRDEQILNFWIKLLKASLQNEKKLFSISCHCILSCHLTLKARRRGEHVNSPQNLPVSHAANMRRTIEV